MGQVRLFGNQRQDLGRELFQWRNASAARLRCGASPLAPALQPLHGRAHTDLETFGRLASRRARLVFIDETAVSTNMVRLRGRAPRGARVIGTVPLGAWETITFVAALRHNEMTAPMVIEGAMNGEMFLAYVEQCLVPTLRRNDIVVLDNCRIHLVAGVQEAIEKARATVRYLPKYSPDLNPIELSYSKFKTLMRKVAARTVPGLNRAIRSFIPQLSPQECANYFCHAGYASK